MSRYAGIRFTVPLLVGLSLAGPAAGVRVQGAEDVTVVRNGAASAHGLQVVELEELWRAGGEGDNLMLVGQHATMADNTQTRTWYVGRFDAVGRELARCWNRPCVIDFNHPVIRESTILDPVMFASTAGLDGTVYLAAERERYAIDVHAADGRRTRVIEREFTPRRRTELETGRVQAVFELWASRDPADIDTEVEPMAATITNLCVDDAGALWVEHSRSVEAGPPAALLTCNVFDAQGRFDRQVALVGEGDPRDDRLFWVRDDMVVLVKGAVPALYASMAAGAAGDDEADAAGDMEVVCYRVPR